MFMSVFAACKDMVSQKQMMMFVCILFTIMALAFGNFKPLFYSMRQNHFLKLKVLIPDAVYDSFTTAFTPAMAWGANLNANFTGQLRTEASIAVSDTVDAVIVRDAANAVAASDAVSAIYTSLSGTHNNCSGSNINGTASRRGRSNTVPNKVLYGLLVADPGVSWSDAVLADPF